MLEGIEKFREAWVEGGLEKEGREMEVTGGGEVGDIEVGDGHLGHDAGVGEHVALVAMGEQEGNAGTGAGVTGDVRDVEAGFGEACEGDVAHLVGSYLRGEADAGAEEREIMSEDGG